MGNDAVLFYKGVQHGRFPHIGTTYQRKLDRLFLAEVFALRVGFEFMFDGVYFCIIVQLTVIFGIQLEFVISGLPQR
jgi:hypothetical protein